MRRYFNTEAQCVPDEHYMVRLDERLAEIRERYVDRGKYFVINRGRQYGKTTTLYALAEYLQDEYAVFSMDFQEMTEMEYRNGETFSVAVAKLLIKAARNAGMDSKSEWLEPVLRFAEPDGEHSMMELFARISRMCADAPKPAVLIIDEVDSAGNNQVLIEFLTLLRRYYIERRSSPIFQSVVLAGVYDIKNLKLEIRSESEHQFNSPWNIAANFDIDMNFSAKQIAAMLKEYEADNHTGMDIPAVAEEIYQYTSGYPYLVSAICKLLDEKLPRTEHFSDGKSAWGTEGICEAVKLLLKERDVPLFGSMVKTINLGMMFGYLKEQDGRVIIANRIFEMALLNHQNSSDDAADGGIRNNLAKAYQQSVDILSSLVDNLLTAGIIDLYDGSYTVLKDRTGKTVMNARHPYTDFFCTWMKPFLLEESEEGLHFSALPYLEAKLKENKKVTQDYHIRGGMWLRCTWTPFRNPDCEDNRILLYSANVTEEYEGNAQLTARTQEREAIIQGLGDVYFSVLLVDYQHDYVTVFRHEDEDGREIAEYFAKFGFCWSEGLAQYCADLVSEDTGETLRKALSVENLEKAEDGFSINYQKKSGNGLRYLEVWVSFVKKSDSSRVAVVGTRNVDDTVRHEKELRTRLQMIAAAAGTVYPLVAEVNLTRNTYQIVSYDRFVNKTAAVGGTMDDFIAAGVSTLPDKGEAEAFEKLFCRQSQIDAFRRGEKELQLRHRQTGDDGLIHWMDTRVIFVSGEDGDMHEISMSRCIDDEIKLNEDLAKAKNAAEAANRAKSTFLFNMSHDIRTPMNAIMGFTDLALQHIDNSDNLEDYLKKIKTSSDYMLKLLNSVLEMARIEKGKLTLDYEPAELAEVFRDGLSLFEDKAKHQNLQYRYSIGFDEIAVNIDRVRVEEILSNVVSNAIKYTVAGGRVDVSATLTEKQDSWYELTLIVQDTGVGMSKEFLPNIFDSFERERNEATREIQGTGLGMGITQKLVEIMDGTIEVESELGVGTTVTVKIPVEGVVSPSTLRENARPEDFADLFRGKRLLLAEDNDLNAEIAMELLGEAGLFVERAVDGVECVSMLCRAKPHYYDAILMDIQMPNLDGYMATMKIRRLNDPEKSDIPIIAMTANAFEEDRRKALDTGMDGFLAKPVEMNKLFETLAGIIK